MARILIEPAKAKRVLPKYSELEKTLKGLYQEVKDIRSGLTFKIGVQEAINARLDETAEQINQEAGGAQALNVGVEQIIARYEQAEGGNVELVGAEARMGWQEDGLTDQLSIQNLLDALIHLTSEKVWPFLPLLAIIAPAAPPGILLSGLLAGMVVGSNRDSVDGSWLGYEFADGHPGVTAWIGKVSAKSEGSLGSAGVNAYLGKVEASAESDAHFMEKVEKRKYIDGEWTEKDEFSIVDLEAKASVSASVLAGDANLEVGNDYLGLEGKAEGSAGNANLEAAGEFSVGENGVSANLSGKAMVSAAEGKASGTINILGVEITGKIGGYAGAVGVEGKIGIDDNKFVIEGGAAALLGASGGVEIGFNGEGWSTFWDIITFWD